MASGQEDQGESGALEELRTEFPRKEGLGAQCEMTIMVHDGWPGHGLLDSSVGCH